ncbi:ATP-binding protein [Aequorivita sp. SDUM287046]|uniref:histidine kinase n=1 Tax=Aequorivita aurantiaca TaxID=3053356 RepID=A0ABT8DI19_9FLAO|nr:ATP-binding protein [Aequorivita aurantiaca]MDN3724449.1 ATP-binding protein [Aequorivita aurantiaca]
MATLTFSRQSLNSQYLISIAATLLLSVGCYFMVEFIGYRTVALVLLLLVSLLAMVFKIYPVMVTAFLSALIWNFLFIPPTLTFHIGTPEDFLMFLMYFVVALINAVLTYKIRQFERKKRVEDEKTQTIKLYNTLLNSLSHELRTPLATIIGAIDTIKDSANQISEANKKELYTEIEIASFRLNRQVENLLNMSRLEAGTLKPTYDWFDVNELVFNTIKQNQESQESHNILFHPNEQLPLIKIDGGFIEVILHNLIHNALQHTPKNARIFIDVLYRQTHLVITVSDEGSGFPKAEIDFVFDKFYKLNGTASGGTGLGLSIVKGFTEALNGKIFLENCHNGGARFTIEIPVETASILELDSKNEQN